MEEKRPVHDKIKLPVKIKFKKEAQLEVKAEENGIFEKDI